MVIESRTARAAARLVACAALLLVAAQAAQAQQAAQPADAPAELPPLEVTAKKAAKKAPAKKSQAKAVPKAAPQPQPAAADTEEGPTGVTNAAAPVKDYVATDATTGTKTDTPLKETPQSISVIGKEQIRDQGVQNLQEALRYTPGVVADSFGYDSRYDGGYIRGSAAAYFVDGLRTTYGFGYTTSMIDPYALERAEVLRGPASMLYGQAPTGGMVNAISKLPSEIPYREIGVEYGSFDFKQVKLDMTGPLTEDGKWLYRIVGLARDADTQVDFVENDRLMLAPSITYRPTNRTSITLLGNFRKDESGSTLQFLPHEGTLYPNTATGQRVPRDTFVGEPGDYYNTEAQSGTLFFDHEFSDALKISHTSRYSNTNTDYESTYAAVMTGARFGAINSLLADFGLPNPSLPPDNAPFLNPGRSEIARSRTAMFNETDVISTDTHLTGKFSTGWVDHTVTGGVDFTHYRTKMESSGTLIDNLLTSNAVNQDPFVNPFIVGAINFFFGGLQPAFDIYNPTYGQSSYLLSLEGGAVDPNNLPKTTNNADIQRQTGIYIQDQIKMGPWAAVLGLRQDWLKVKQGGEPDQYEEATTGRAALMYNFNFGLTPYVAYSSSFYPLPGTPVADHILADVDETRPAGPVEGEQVEIGFKYQPAGAPFAVNASIYELTERNQTVQPDYLFQAVQGADVNVRGFEIEALGRLTPELKIIGSYSYTDATYDKYPELYNFGFPSGVVEFMKGKPVDFVPKHLASLWAIYSFQDGPLRGLSFGGGVRYVGATESYAYDVASLGELYVKTPSFTLFDAMIAYETPDWRWQITGQNLEDEYHVVGCSAMRGDCGVGQARTIITGFTYKF
ncbi:TonB-dependent receptor [Hyphomicrobium sp.]|uniref:TonB-dependent siderophore receptor n=1 Tax=Hyphomicrobium sp. TaxID=82 RepID=UPI0025C4A670|nr:TonB-dependent receptor [Hyphomicrobium sp.]MCC7253999.1 TonB-dependent receptor [Hyphomicrobium sp.]